MRTGDDARLDRHLFEDPSGVSRGGRIIFERGSLTGRGSLLFVQHVRTNLWQERRFPRVLHWPLYCQENIFIMRYMVVFGRFCEIVIGTSPKGAYKIAFYSSRPSEERRRGRPSGLKVGPRVSTP